MFALRVIITAAFVFWRLTQKAFVSGGEVVKTNLPNAGVFVLSPNARATAGGMLLFFPWVRTWEITGLNWPGCSAENAIDPN